MAKSKRHLVTRIRNSGKKPMIFVLEPWGEVYGMPPAATFEILSDEPPDDKALEMDAGGDTVTVYGWVGSSLWVTHNGRRPRIIIPDQETATRYLKSGRTSTGRSPRARQVAATAST